MGIRNKKFRKIQSLSLLQHAAALKKVAEDADSAKEACANDVARVKEEYTAEVEKATEDAASAKEAYKNEAARMKEEHMEELKRAVDRAAATSEESCKTKVARVKEECAA